MIPTRITTRGLTCPDGTISIPYAVAVQGPTGAGKTTLLRAIGAALFGGVEHLRRHGAETASVELTFDHGDVAYRVTRTVRGKSKGYTFERRDGGEWITEDRTPEQVIGLGPEAAALSVLLYARGVDGLGSFLAMAPAARRTALAEWIGSDRYLSLATDARQRATAADRERASVDGQATQLGRELVDDRKRAEEPIPTVPPFDQAALDAAGAELELALARQAEHKAAARAYANAIADRNNLETQRPALQAEIERIESALAGAERDSADAVREAEVAAEALAAAKQRASEQSSRLALLCADLRQSSMQADSERVRVERLAESAAVVTDVPCRAEGDYAACPLLASALRDRDALPAARDSARSLAESAALLSAQAAEAGDRAERLGDAARDAKAQHEHAAARVRALPSYAELRRRRDAIQAQLERVVELPPDPGPVAPVSTDRVNALRAQRDAHLAAAARASAVTAARAEYAARAVERQSELDALTARSAALAAEAARAKAEEVELRAKPGLALADGLAKTGRVARGELGRLGSDLSVELRLDGTKSNPSSEVHVDITRNGEPVRPSEGEAWLVGLALACGLGAAFGRVEWIGIDGGAETVKGDLADRLPAALADLPIGVWVCSNMPSVADAMGETIVIGD